MVDNSTLHDSPDEKFDSSRRSVLGALGLSGVSRVDLESLGKPTEKENRKFIGVTYDTRTQLVQDVAEASLTFKRDWSVSGMLKIAGFNVPLGDTDSTDTSPTPDQLRSYYLTKDSKPFLRDGLPLVVQFQSDSDHVVGYATRPAPEYANLSFSLNAKDRGATVGKIEAALGDVDLSKFDTDPEIPDTGIPTETSIVNMKGTGGNA